MYQSKFCISSKGMSDLKNLLKNYLKRHSTLYCKALKRKVSLAKLPDAIAKRGKGTKKRLARFKVAMDILRNAKTYTTRVHHGKREYEIVGIDRTGILVRIHLREESSSKDRQLFFVSCF